MGGMMVIAVPCFADAAGISLQSGRPIADGNKSIREFSVSGKNGT